ncbi:unnamed protein product [Blepharisma stoltei]|uniref:Tyrosine-protein phosphatase domain-containing protein n=1 Tax=Blepharisma stoltei TaxID=1481888 RepID=A0AAU9ING5_9CILI|nr:unnamed protein product [Blepharisma stoltei]
MDPDFSYLDHNRFSNVANYREHIPRRPRANTTLTPSLKLLVDVWSHLPESEKSAFSHFSGLEPRHSSDSPQSPVKRKARRSNTLAENIKNKKFTKHPTGRNQSCIIEHLEPAGSEKLIFEIPNKDDISGNEFVYKIYIGNTEAANDETLLRTYMIDSVLALGLEGSPEKYTSVRRGYLRLEVGRDLLEAMDAIQRFLDIQLKRGHVLVQCPTGKTIAPAAVIGYFIKRFNIIFSYARDTIAKYVSGMKLNPEHIKQLKSLSIQNV